MADLSSIDRDLPSLERAACVLQSGIDLPYSAIRRLTHPFVVEHRISETEAIYEGLYVFDPAALGPPCGAVKLTVYSEGEPDKGDARVVDQKVLQQITRDFEPL